jgi:4'-phosphopantetheinyl transferase
MSAPEVAEARAQLSPDERARCDRFLFERDRRDFAAAHALLRGALRLHGGFPQDCWQFGSDAEGKPFLLGQSKLEFNIAHTRGLVACALSLEGAIGVDVEPVDIARNTEEIAERYFAESEILALKACAHGLERQTRFTELWTLKEAYVKALGMGLRQSLDEFWFEFQRESKLRFNAPIGSGSKSWRFGLFAPLPNYRLAVAVRADPSLEFCVRRWPLGRGTSLPPIRVSP